MQLIDISTDSQKTYTLKKNERCVFFMLNRVDDISFELANKNSEAHIFAFFIGNDMQKKNLRISQRHLARETTSTAEVKSALSGDSEFSYEGSIYIAKGASLANASQESRSLLLSPESKAFSRPALEILAHDVKCRHAATVSPLNKEALFFTQSRGLSKTKAKKLLLKGFFNQSINAMQALGADTEDIEKILEKYLN